MKTPESWLRRLGVIVSAGWLLAGWGLTAGAAPVISEIMASNETSGLDGDGDASDWLEIFNPDAVAVDLAGWHLTDSAADPVKWTFPAGVVLPAGGFLRVWASGKDRRTDPAALHTDFSLSAEGEYLALVPPAGGTAASAFSPAFPALREDESYGVPFVSTTLIAPGAEATVLAPAVESPGWMQREFVPGASWLPMPLSVGFGMPAIGFFVEERQSNQPLTTMAAAEAVLGGINAEDLLTGLRPVVNFVSAGGMDGRYSGGVPFLHPGVPRDFAVRATASITLPAGGQWTFHVNSSDGFRLYLDGGLLMQQSGIRDAADSLNTRTLTAGVHVLKLTYFGGTGSNAVEVSMAPGAHQAFSDAFELVGDTGHGGLPAFAPVDSGVNNPGTDLGGAMRDAGSSAYVRVPFVLTDPAEVETLGLAVAYNDGFIAYLNGTEVARRAAPDGADHLAAATAVRSAAQSLSPENIILSAFRPLLVAGENVLAFQALNASAADPTFYLDPQLTASRRIAGAGRYFRQATPGLANTTPGVLGHVDAPVANPPRGFFEVPALVTLTSGTPGAVIRYTVNGSVPSLANGTVYSGPVPLDKTTVLRVAAFLGGFEASPPVTHTYLFLNDVIRQGTARPTPEWPDAGTVNGQVINYGMDPVIVNNTNPALGGAAATLAALRSLPAVCVTAGLPDLFHPTTGIYVNADGHGRSWERPGSLELIGDSTTAEGGFQSGCGLRMRGGVSRRDSNPKHGWRVFFRKEYGAGKLQYPVYGGEGAAEFDGFDLQCAQNYSWSRDGGLTYNALREIWSRDTQLAMGQPATRGRFVHLFLNGLYWGLHQIQERADASFGESRLGGRDEDFDVIKHAGLDGAHTVEATDGYFTTLPEGGDSAWKQLWTGSREAYFIQRDRNPASPAAALISTAQEKLAAYYKLQGLAADGRTPTGGPVLLEVDNLIDYMILILFSKNSDSSISAFYENARPNNFYCLRNRRGGLGFVSINHDAEHTLDAPGAADRWGPWQTDTGGFWNNINYSNPQYLHQDLSGSPEYKIRFADRLHRHFRQDGALATANNLARLDARSVEIEPAIIAESARWGDAQATPARTVANWRTARTTTRNWFNNRNAQFLAEARARGFYPALEPPVLNPRGGILAPGQTLTLTHPNPGGIIYFTTDGSDPRPAGGGPVAAGTPYAGPLVMDRPGQLKARVLQGAVWSALEEAGFSLGTVPASAANLVVSEFCYAPAGPRTAEESSFAASDFEFIELQNISAYNVDLAGVRVGLGVDYEIAPPPAQTVIPPGGRWVLSPNPTAFSRRYSSGGATAAGPFSGKLNNDGEGLRLSAADGALIKEFSYSPQAPWPGSPATLGHSLVLLHPSANPDHNDPAQWRASAFPDGQPYAGKTTTFAAWQLACGSGAGDSDPWHLGLPALAVYALGAAPGLVPADLLPAAGTVMVPSGGTVARHATLAYRQRLSAADILYTIESSSSLAAGSWIPADMVLVSVTDHGDGTATRHYQTRQAVPAGQPLFLRVRFSLR